MITLASPTTPTADELAAFDGGILLGFLVVAPILHKGEPILNMVVGEEVPARALGTDDRIRGLLADGSILPVYARDGFVYTGFLPPESSA